MGKVIFFIGLLLMSVSLCRASLNADGRVSTLNCSDSSLYAAKKQIEVRPILLFDGSISMAVSKAQFRQHQLINTLGLNRDVLCNKSIDWDPNSVMKYFSANLNYDLKYLGTIYFASGSDRAYSSAKENLRKKLQLISQYDGLLAIGSTDTIGEAKMNETLSWRRANNSAVDLQQNKPVAIIALGSMYMKSRPHTNDPKYRKADVYYYRLKN